MKTHSDLRRHLCTTTQGVDYSRAPMAISRETFVGAMQFLGLVETAPETTEAGQCGQADDVWGEATRRLQHTLVELDRVGPVGRLSEYGAGCVLDALRMAGLKIVREPH